MYDNVTNITAYHYAVLMQKGGEFSVLALSRGTHGITMLGRSGRDGIHRSLQTEGFEAAKRNFENSILSSVDNGWSVAWRGFPYGRPRCCSSVRSGEPGAKFCGHCGGRLDGQK